MGAVLPFRTIEPPQRVVFGRALIQRLVVRAAEITRVPAKEIYGRRRKRDIAWTRFAVMTVAREQGKSFPRIGAVFGFDHTSVLHAVRRAGEIASKEPEYADLLRLLREEAAR